MLLNLCFFLTREAASCSLRTAWLLASFHCPLSAVLFFFLVTHSGPSLHPSVPRGDASHLPGRPAWRAPGACGGRSKPEVGSRLRVGSGSDSVGPSVWGPSRTAPPHVFFLLGWAIIPDPDGP